MAKFRKPHYIPPHLTTGSEEQGYVEQIFRPFGSVYRLVNYGGGGSHSGGTKGVADNLIFLPEWRILLGWDAKAGRPAYRKYDPVTREPLFGGGYLTDEQATFGKLMQAGYRTMFGWGDRDRARAFLLALANGGDPHKIITAPLGDVTDG